MNAEHLKRIMRTTVRMSTKDKWRSKHGIDSILYKLFSITIPSFFKSIDALCGHIVIPHVDIALTTKCTLKCQNCCHLIPMYKEPWDLDIANLSMHIGRLLDCTDRINRVNLVGGEPFLYREIDQVVRILKDSGKVRFISIVTNGTIIPSESTLGTIKENEVIVYISNYGSLSKNLHPLCEILRRNSIQHYVTNTQMWWYDFGDFKCRGRSMHDSLALYRNCDLDCMHLLDGKFHMCCRSSHAMRLGLIPDIQEDYVDFGKEGSSKRYAQKKLRTLLTYKHPLSVCNFCDGKKVTVLSASQVREDT